MAIKVSESRLVLSSKAALRVLEPGDVVDLAALKRSQETRLARHGCKLVFSRNRWWLYGYAGERALSGLTMDVHECAREARLTVYETLMVRGRI